ncbi:386_t:CDS:2, partial [Cetraspora pellucida]
MGLKILEKIDQELINNSKKYHGVSKSDNRYQECLTILRVLGKYSGFIPEHASRIILQMFKFSNHSIQYHLLLNYVLKIIKSDKFCLNETGENNNEALEKRVDKLQDIIEFIDHIQKPFKLLSNNDIPKFVKITSEDNERMHQISYFEKKTKQNLGLVHFQNINYDDSKVLNHYKNITPDFILDKIIIDGHPQFGISQEERYDAMDEVGSDHDDVLNSENEIEQGSVSQHIGDEEYLLSNDDYLDDMIANDLSAPDNIIDNETLPSNYIPLPMHKVTKLKSKILNYFNPFQNKNNLTNTVSRCTIEIIHNNRQAKCNKIIVTGGGSTGNFWDHLGAIHEITKDNNTKFTKSNQQNIKYTFQNPMQQKLQNQALVEFIIEDDQPLNILELKKFQIFIASLDPNYKLPTNKFVKQIIYEAYNYSLNTLIQKLNLAISCSLTCDLWTSYSRDGYLGVTCHWIDNEFKLNEIVLGIYKCEYPHTGETIKDMLNNIMNEWKIESKVISITTDNTTNFKKAIELLNLEIYHIKCLAHTLQLAIRKGLMPAKKLITKIKHLLAFFTSSKQSERLEIAQKDFLKISSNK